MLFPEMLFIGTLYPYVRVVCIPALNLGRLHGTLQGGPGAPGPAQIFERMFGLKLQV